jgi:hypothetical protein
MENIEIKYTFKFDEHLQEVIELKLNPITLEVVNRKVEVFPEWTRLDYHQCPHCPLVFHETTYCPVAVSLIDIVSRFHEVTSHEPVDLEVISAERTVSQRTDAQRGISSLVGLLISTSGCPHTDFFKPMARFHLPVSSYVETIFRATGMYLLGQYFRKKDGKRDDLELHGLFMIYDNLHLLNVNIAKRLRSYTAKDSSVNAVVILDVFTQTLQNVVKDQWEDIRPLFTPYLSGSYHDLVEGQVEPGD